jgi:hypothetical protein
MISQEPNLSPHRSPPSRLTPYSAFPDPDPRISHGKVTLPIFTSLIIWEMRMIDTFIERGHFRRSMAKGPTS